jgi:hypothetical protein
MIIKDFGSFEIDNLLLPGAQQHETRRFHGSRKIPFIFGKQTSPPGSRCLCLEIMLFVSLSAVAYPYGSDYGCGCPFSPHVG